MPTWHPKAGECLLIDSGPIGKHLFVLVLEKKINNKLQVLSVPVCTVRDVARVDDSCVVQPGEHSFVKNESFVEYKYSRIDPADHLLERVKEKTFIPNDPVSLDLLNRIKDGLIKSKQVPRYIKDEIFDHP